MFAGRGYRVGVQSAIRHTMHLARATTFGAVALAGICTPVHAGEQPGAQTNPAHAIAEKFARTSGDAARPSPDSTAARSVPSAQTATTPQSEAESSPDDLQRAYEEDMLARARAEAEARLKDDMTREQEAALQRAQAEAAARNAKAQASAQRLPREKADAEEQALKLEEANRAADEARQKAVAEGLARQRETEARELAERLRAARRSREEARALATAETEASAQADARLKAARESLRQRSERLAGRLDDLRTRREQSEPGNQEQLATRTVHRQPDTDDVQPTPAQYPLLSPVDAASSDTYRATVLLVMKPGTRGIRRWNKTADPMLCVEDSCYISTGADVAATRVSRRKGFGPGIAMGTRAGACNHQLTCVFRDVDFGSRLAWMQPIDLRIVRHDRREARRVGIDPTCVITNNRISCTRTIESDGYRAWVIPEHLAVRAGPAALQAALASNLETSILARSPAH